MSINIVLNFRVEMVPANCLMRGNDPANADRANVETVKQEEIWLRQVIGVQLGHPSF